MTKSTYKNNNMRYYYLLVILLSPGFILPNWVFYFARYITIPAIALIDGLSKVFGIIFEIPSGTFSDVFGKKRTLIVSSSLFILCSVILIIANNFFMLLLGNIVMFLAFALKSGTIEALLYDSLLENNQQDQYESIQGKVSSVEIGSMISTVFMGGMLYAIKPELTFVAWIIFSALAIIILLFMSEPKVKSQLDNANLENSKHYFKTLSSGIRSIFSHSKVNFVLPVLFFSMLIKSYEGVVRQTTGAYFGFNGETFGYVFALISIPALVISFNFARIKNFFQNKINFVISCIYLIGFLLVILTNSLVSGVLSFITIYIAQGIARPYVISKVNKESDSKHRATALSTVALFSEIPYIIVTVFFGVLLKIDNLKYFYIILILALIAYNVIYYANKKRQN